MRATRTYFTMDRIDSRYLWTARLTRIGGIILRYSLVFFLLMFGAAKFTEAEAKGIESMMAHSPFLFWVDQLLGVRGGSDLIGCVEITIGMLIALRRFRPFLSACGSLWASGMFLLTLSFLFSTPGLDPQGPDTGFLLKDLTLLGAALWTAGEALAASASTTPPTAQSDPTHPTRRPARAEDRN